MPTLTTCATLGMVCMLPGAALPLCELLPELCVLPLGPARVAVAENPMGAVADVLCVAAELADEALMETRVRTRV